MGRNRLSFRFPNIPINVFKNIDKSIRQQLSIYNNSQSQMVKLEEEIIELREDIKEKQRKVEEVRRRCEKILVENKHLTEDFGLRMYPTYIKKGNGSWNINLKYKGLTKPIYVGTKEYVNNLIKTDKAILCTHNNLPKNLSEDFIKKMLVFLIEDELWERIMDNPNENLLSTKITFSDLYQP